MNFWWLQAGGAGRSKKNGRQLISTNGAGAN
jgi:hypothetical protein